MHGNRPWDFEQEFEVTPEGEVRPAGYYEQVANRHDFKKANEVEREEVRELADDARKRHGQESNNANHGWHANEIGRELETRRVVELHDVPWGRRPV